MITELISNLKGFFSNSFWFGNFLPVAIVTVFHLLLVEYAHPGTAPIGEWWQASLSEQASTTTLAVFGLVILAYALGAFTPAIRDIMDGRALPRKWHDKLRDDRIKAWDRERNDTQLAGLLMGLKGTVELGDGLNFKLEPKREGVPGRAPRLSSVSQQIAQLKSRARENEPLGGNEVQDALEDLELMVEETNQSNASDDREKWIDTASVLGQITELKAIIAPAIADFRYQTRVFSQGIRPNEIAATRVGDARLMLESYSRRTYDVEFEYLWPRLQLVMAADAEASKRLIDAQAQLNFAVLLFGLLQTIPLFWVIKFSLMSEPVAVLAVAVVSVALMWFVYEMAVQSQIALTHQVWSVIDKHRLAVLQEVTHLEKPKTLLEERKLWEALRVSASTEGAIDLFYKHDG